MCSRLIASTSKEISHESYRAVKAPSEPAQEMRSYPTERHSEPEIPVCAMNMFANAVPRSDARSF